MDIAGAAFQAGSSHVVLLDGSDIVACGHTGEVCVCTLGVFAAEQPRSAQEECKSIFAEGLQDIEGAKGK